VDEKQLRAWVEIFYYVILIVVAVYAIEERPPIAMTFWRGVCRAAYRVARVFGDIGLQAEAEYWYAVERSRA